MPPRRGRKRGGSPGVSPGASQPHRVVLAAGSVRRGRQEMVKALVVARGFVIFCGFLPLKKKKKRTKRQGNTPGGCRMRPGAASTKTCPEKKTGIGAPWAEERRKGPARVPQALHFTTAERNLQKIIKKKKKTPWKKINQSKAEKQVRGCYRKARCERKKPEAPSAPCSPSGGGAGLVAPSGSMIALVLSFPARPNPSCLIAQKKSGFNYTTRRLRPCLCHRQQGVWG